MSGTEETETQETQERSVDGLKEGWEERWKLFATDVRELGAAWALNHSSAEISEGEWKLLVKLLHELDLETRELFASISKGVFKYEKPFTERSVDEIREYMNDEIRDLVGYLVIESILKRADLSGDTRTTHEPANPSSSILDKEAREVVE